MTGNKTPVPAVLQLLVVSLLLLGMLFFAGCASAQTESPPGIQITLEPATGHSDGFVTVILADVNNQPITDATVSLEGNMNHAGMAPVLADGVRDEADGAADGRYWIPFEFTMLGDWILTVSATQDSGVSHQQDIDVIVGENSATVK